MKRNRGRKTDRRIVITARKNEKKRKSFRTGLKVGIGVGSL